MIVDRSFRDVISTINQFGYQATMPSFLNRREQLDIEDANYTQRVTKVPSYMSKLKVEFNYSTIVGKGQKKAFHYQCFPENLTKKFSSVGSSNLMLILINY